MAGPDKERRLQIARQDEEFAREILNSGDKSRYRWAITTAFYSAIQIGRALASLYGVTVRQHGHFEGWFLSATGRTDLYKHYRHMKDASEAARYDCGVYEHGDVARLIQHRLVPWRDEVMKLIEEREAELQERPIP